MPVIDACHRGRGKNLQKVGDLATDSHVPGTSI